MTDIPTNAVAHAAEALFQAEAMGETSHYRLALAALEAALPHLGLPARRPRTVCPACTREVVRRDDGNPSSHPTRDRAAVCEHGHCRGGCRGCRT